MTCFTAGHEQVPQESHLHSDRLITREFMLESEMEFLLLTKMLHTESSYYLAWYLQF